MIRNIEDEKKKLRQHHDGGFSGYLSERALNGLIEQVESQEMLRAPVHLKDNVVAQIRRERRRAKKRQVFAYRVKVLAAMAAALTVLVLMPDDRTGNGNGAWSVQQTQEESLEQMVIRQREEMDADWERYLRERESGGVRGFFRNINDKVTEFGTSLYDSIGGEQD